MTIARDPEFQLPAAKGFAADPNLPTSRLAIVSLVFGILAYVALPFLGAIVAIVTGHRALRQIGESGGRLGGRDLARTGTILGYVQLWQALMAILILALSFWFRVSSDSAILDVATPSSGPNDPAPGVRMSNEMTRGDIALIDAHAMLDPDEEIIGCAVAKSPSHDPELGLLTTRRLVYLKQGRVTAFRLEEVASVVEDAEPPQYSHVDGYSDCVIDVERDSGARMRLKVRPYSQGKTFGKVVTNAWKRARDDVAPKH